MGLSPWNTSPPTGDGSENGGWLRCWTAWMFDHGIHGSRGSCLGRILADRRIALRAMLGPLGRVELGT